MRPQYLNLKNCCTVEWYLPTQPEPELQVKVKIIHSTGSLLFCWVQFFYILFCAINYLFFFYL